jgi:hypothetical protein
MKTQMMCAAVAVCVVAGAAPIAWADVTPGYSLQPGTVLSTHTPETNVCRITHWQLWIGPRETVRGAIEEEVTDKFWSLSGTYDSQGTFHLKGQDPDGTEGATVDAQVQPNGSMIFRMADPADPSQCYNRVVYLPWFRNGNDFNPHGGAGDGSGG